MVECSRSFYLKIDSPNIVHYIITIRTIDKCQCYVLLQQEGVEEELVEAELMWEAAVYEASADHYFEGEPDCRCSRVDCNDCVLTIFLQEYM